MRHHGASGEEVVELVGAADLDVGLDRDGVVRLHERVEELRQRDRLVRGEALREVVPLEQLRDGQRSRQPHDVGVGRASRATRRCGGSPCGRGRGSGTPARRTRARSRRAPRRRAPAAPSSVPTDRRSAPCSRRRSARRRGPRAGTSASRSSTHANPRWMSGAVGSIPSFTRSGCPRGELLREQPLREDVDGVLGEAREGVGAHGEPIVPAPGLRDRSATAAAREHDETDERRRAPRGRRRATASRGRRGRRRLHRRLRAHRARPRSGSRSRRRTHDRGARSAMRTWISVRDATFLIPCPTPPNDVHHDHEAERRARTGR